MKASQPAARRAPPRAADSRPSFDDITTNVNIAQRKLAARPDAHTSPGEPRAQPAPPARAAASSPNHRVVAASPRAIVADMAQPAPELVLEQLARVGLFEPRGGAAPAWERAPRQKTRGVLPLLALIVLVGGSGVGAYRYVNDVKAQRAERAAVLSTEVEALLHSGRTADLRASDEKLGQAFDLNSRSSRAARLWLENRVLGALLLVDEPRGVDSAVHRGREVGLPEATLAVGRVASFFVEGDLAGAAALLPKWDARAGRDAIYQLTAGAVLERAGDARAIERFAAARALDPKLAPAGLLLARSVLLEQGPEKAAPVLDDLKKQLSPGDPNGRAISALAWIVAPDRSAEPPAEVRLSAAEAEQLIAPLSAVPPLLDAVVALGKGEHAETAVDIDKALSLVDGPALAASLGFLAIELGNEALARKAALKALSFAALYPRARTLAARVALLGGRLDEAQKAVEELDPKSAEVAVVQSAVAYENANAAELTTALAALDPKATAYQALAAGPAILLGSRYPDAAKLDAMASPAVAWGEIVAADAALDTSNTALAAKILAGHENDASPVRLLRVARLRRYQKRVDDALTASAAAFSDKPSVPLIVERTLELLEKDDPAGARTLVARHPALLGPAAQWLGVLIDLASKQPKLAASRLSQLDPPPDEAPVYLRAVAARALAASHDKRARGYVIALARRLNKHPDVLAAAELLNAH